MPSRFADTGADGRGRVSRGWHRGTASGAEARASRRELRHLRRMVPFLAPYRLQIGAGAAALALAAATVLVFGDGLRWLVDHGFASGDTALLDRALGALFVVVALLGAASWLRSYFVSWIGERVAADLRRAVFDRIIGLDAAFFEGRDNGLTTRHSRHETCLSGRAPAAATD